MFGIRPTTVLLALLCCATAAQSAATQTLDRIAASKQIRIGFIGGQAPFSSNESDKPAGYAIDLCNQVAGQIGRTVGGVQSVYVETTLDQAFAAVANDQIDLLCGAITATLGRRQTVDFSQPIFFTGMSALLRTDAPRDLRELFLGERTVSPPRSPALRPFATSRIGVRAGTTTEDVLLRTIREKSYGASVVTFAEHSDGLAALESGDIDAYFADRALLGALHDAAQSPTALILADRLFTREAYGIAMKRGDADLRLLVDKTLTEFFGTPDFGSLLETYFKSDAPALQAQISQQSIPE